MLNLSITRVSREGGDICMTKKNVPVWSKRVQKKMIDMGLSKKELAKALNRNYPQLVSVMNGKLINDTITKEICNYFNMEV